jgi:uncharacterized protein (DUF1810 family)
MSTFNQYLLFVKRLLSLFVFQAVIVGSPLLLAASDDEKSRNEILDDCLAAFLCNYRNDNNMAPNARLDQNIFNLIRENARQSMLDIMIPPTASAPYTGLTEGSVATLTPQNGTALAGGLGLDDPFNLEYFLSAQNNGDIGDIGGDERAPRYNDVLAELGAGSKLTHWIWYIFPQGNIYPYLGYRPSSAARRFALTGIEAAQAYLQNELLCQRLTDCTKNVIQRLNKGQSLEYILGNDASKFISSMTLFSRAQQGANPHSPNIFSEALWAAQVGEDPVTVRFLEDSDANSGSHEDSKPAARKSRFSRFSKKK